jgi:hypothetical protein
MSVDIDLMHMLLIQNTEIGMPIRDLAFALGVRETEVEVALINEGSLGNVRFQDGPILDVVDQLFQMDSGPRYYTLKKHFQKNVSLRIEDECLIALHQLLYVGIEQWESASKTAIQLEEIQDRLGFNAELIKETLFQEKTLGRITYVSADSLAYVSTLEFPVENLVDRVQAIQTYKTSNVSKWTIVGGILAGMAGIISYFLL